MTIEATCKRVLQLDAEATPGPWGVNAGPLISTSLIVFATDGIVHEQVTGDVFEGHDADLIATYRTAAPELARECQRLAERVGELEGERSREKKCAANQREHGDKPCRSCHTCWLYYREEKAKALAKVAELQAQLDLANATVKLLQRPHTDTMRSVDETCRAALSDRMDPEVADVLVDAVSEFVLSHVNASAYYRDQLDRPTKPRPMSEAPRDGMWLTVSIDVAYDSGRACWEDTGGFIVELRRADGWLPATSDQSKEGGA